MRIKRGILLGGIAMLVLLQSHTETQPPELINYCSDAHKEFSLEPLEIDIEKTECFSGTFKYVRFFTFKAKTSFVDFSVRVSEGKNAIKDPAIYLMDDQKKPIICTIQKGHERTIGIAYNKLEKKKNYYIAVLSNYPNKNATFGFCINTQIDQGSYKFAKEITQEKYCSEKLLAVHSFMGSYPGVSYLKNGAHQNVWYTFKAKNTGVKIEVKPGGEKAYLEYPIIGLFDKDVQEQAFGKFTSKKRAELLYYGLIPGQTYYISVDHRDPQKGKGPFLICVDQTQSIAIKGDSKIIGKITSPQNSTALEVDLYDKDTQKKIASTKASLAGDFEFEKLPKQKEYLIKIQTPLPVELEVFLVDQENRIVASSFSQTNQAELSIKKEEPNPFKLFRESSFESVNVEKNKTVIHGKVVDRQEPSIASQGVLVQLFDYKNEMLKEEKTSEKGVFTFEDLNPSKGYSVQIENAQSQHYVEMAYLNDEKQVLMYSHSGLVDENGRFRFQKLPKQEVSLKFLDLKDEKLPLPIETLLPGKSLVLDNLYFRTNSHAILETSFDQLNQLVNTLKENMKLKIKIVGYTDNAGNVVQNQILSEKRAKEVVMFLKKQNVSPDRLTYVGMGMKNPIANNSTQEGKAKNRRVEIEVLK